MSDRYLHIISFDQPDPPNYGGVIDVYYKIKALHTAGVKIILHVFEYGRGRASGALELMCEQVYYYKRQTGLQGFSLLRPYIVNSRRSPKLLTNLLKDNYPILFEGLHTTYYLNHPKLVQRIKAVRAHNVEHDYYKHLAAIEVSFFKRKYYEMEASLLERYESILSNEFTTVIFPISSKDDLYFQGKYSNTHLLFPFHENSQVKVKKGIGNYCLYQGNLSVAENVQAVRFLVQEVFSKTDKPLIVAGSSPTKELAELISLHENVELNANPDKVRMLDLMQHAHIHLLYATQPTGIKLKWINALYQGRFLLGNDLMFNEPTLAQACLVANTATEYIEQVEALFQQEFTQSDIESRKELLKSNFNSEQQIEAMIKAIWPD